jgi:hypothetical protein
VASPIDGLPQRAPMHRPVLREIAMPSPPSNRPRSRARAACRSGRIGIARLLRVAPVGLALAGLAAVAHADVFMPIEDWAGEDGLSGDAIYDRVLANRFDRSTQLLSMSSKDRGGHRQYVELEVKYMKGAPDDDYTSRSIAKYTRPLDLLHMGYLVINKRSGPDDQFVYRPSQRNVRRINARTEAISGTDFTLEDVIPQEAEDAAHYRMPDTEYADRPAFVVTVVPHESTRSMYSKFVVTIEKERAVPLLTDYWDDRGVHVKQLRADPRSIEAFETTWNGEEKRVWLVRRSKMMHLKRESQTVLNVLHFEPSPELTERDFSQRELTAGH